MKSYGLLIATLCALVLGTCWLPYAFPTTHVVRGVSYEAGFSNGVAYLWFVLFLPVPVWAVLRLTGRAGELNDAYRFGDGPSKLFDRFLLLSLIANAALFLAVYSYKGRFFFAEALYFQGLLYRMTMGDVPYLQFSFYYGPAMLYPAAWLTPLVGLDAAYGIWFVATHLAGVVALYAVLRAVLPLRHARKWFVLILLGFLTPWTGLNVTFLRFLLPSAVFLVTSSLLKNGGWLRMLATASLLSFALLFSFEVAALSAMSCLILTAVAVVWRPQYAASSPAYSRGLALARGIGVLVLAAVVCILVFLAIDPTGHALADYPAVAMSYSAGAYNIPITLNPSFLVLAAIAIIAVSGTAWFLRSSKSLTADLRLAAYLVLALVSLRGAFGVADPTHFAYFSLPLLLIGLFITTQGTPWGRIRPWIGVALLAGFIVPLQFYNVSQIMPFFARRSSDRAGASRQSQGVTAPSVGMEAALSEAVVAVGGDRPWQMFGLDYYSLPVYRRFSLRYPTFYTMFENARTPDQVERVIRETRETQATVLIQVEALQPPSITAPSGASSRIQRLLGVQAFEDLAKKNMERLRRPFREFLLAEYHAIWQKGDLVVMVPR